MNTDLINRAIEEAKSIGRERDGAANSPVAESEPSLSSVDKWFVCFEKLNSLKFRNNLHRHLLG